MDANTATARRQDAILERARVALAHAGRTAADFILPPQCAACGARVEAKGHMCGQCWRGLRFISAPFCQRNGLPFAFDPGVPMVSPAALADPPPWDHARAAVLFNDMSRFLIHALKYRDRHDLATMLAKLMVTAAGDILDEAPLVAPVPLHWSRLWRRRFNQSAILAQAFAAQTGFALDIELLVRTRATRQQVGLSSTQRRRNVTGAFKVAPGAERVAAGAHVLLVDDVLTTGATAGACARALRRAGARRVDVLTFARVGEIIETPI